MKSWQTPYVLWTMSRSAGKALSLDTPIPTPNGYKTMGELEADDYVFDENGKPTKIIDTSEIFYNHDCYEIEFDDDEKIIADADHLWYVKNRFNDRFGFTVQKTENIANDYFVQSKGYKYEIPNCSGMSKTIISIKKINSVPTKCITVDNPMHLFLCGEKGTITHNSTLGAPFIMAKSILIPNFQAYILAGVGK